MKRLLPLFAIAFFAAGCSTMNSSGPTMGQCNALSIAAANQLLLAKCAQAPDPLKDESCISISVLQTAAALCLAQVQPAS